jgi:YfiH family protein
MFFPSRSLAGARLVVTDRLGGVSAAPYAALNLGGHVGDDPEAVADNRRRLAAAIDLPARHLALMRQVHGADVAVVNAPTAPILNAPNAPIVNGPADGPAADVPAADAMVSTTRGLALTVLVADCTPVLLAAAEPEVIAVAHAGRRGVQVGVVSATVAAMQRLGAQPARIAAWVGPAICGGCYEVSAQVQADVVRTVPAAESTTRAGTTGLDIRAGVVAQLSAAGVREIEVDPACTAESPDLYSYRRDRVTGRFAGVLWLPARPADG